MCTSRLNYTLVIRLSEWRKIIFIYNFELTYKWTTRETLTEVAEEAKIIMEDKVVEGGIKVAVATVAAEEAAMEEAVDGHNMEVVEVDGIKVVAEAATVEEAATVVAVASIRKEISKKKEATVAEAATVEVVAEATVEEIAAMEVQMLVTVDTQTLMLVETELVAHLQEELLIHRVTTTMAEEETSTKVISLLLKMVK